MQSEKARGDTGALPCKTAKAVHRRQDAIAVLVWVDPHGEKPYDA
jgi:hypothetical protein